MSTKVWCHTMETVNNPRWQGTSHGDAYLASAQFNMKF